MGVEILEDRLTPTVQTFYWIGSDYSNPNSWFTNLGTLNKPHAIQGSFTLKSNSQKAFLVKAGGELKIVKSLEIAGNIDPVNTNSASFGMTGGKITCTNSIELKATNNFDISGGTFKTTNDGVTTTNFTLLFRGNMKVTGGNVEPSRDSDGLHLGALECVGNVAFTGGKYFAYFVGTATSAECNRWIATNGTFTTSDGADIIATRSSGALPAADPQTPRYWDIISATGAIPEAAMLPVLSAPAGVTGVTRSARQKFSLKW